MTARQQYLSYVRQGGDFFCSPQIGAGAGFDAKLAGKTWLSETTTEDTIKACRQFDMLPLFNFPLPDLSCLCDSLRWETVSEALLPDGKRHTARRLSTPRGDLETHFLEQPLLGGAQTKFPVRRKRTCPCWNTTWIACWSAATFLPLPEPSRRFAGKWERMTPWTSSGPCSPMSFWAFPMYWTRLFWPWSARTPSAV